MAKQHRLSFVIVLAFAISRVACNGDHCDRGQPRERWYGFGGSEFLPWSEHIPGAYETTESGVCGTGLGTGGATTIARALSDGSVVIVERFGVELLVSRQRDEQWVTDTLHPENVLYPLHEPRLENVNRAA